MLKNLDIFTSKTGIKFDPMNWNYRMNKLNDVYGKMFSGEMKDENSSSPRFLRNDIAEKIVGNLVGKVTPDSKILVLYSAELIREIMAKLAVKPQNICLISDNIEKSGAVKSLGVNVINLDTEHLHQYRYSVEVIEKIIKGYLEKKGIMKFDAVVGNPPYQEGDVGKQVWQKFIETANNFGNIISMVHPGRWVIPKKSMKKIQQDLINSHLKSFWYYPTSKTVFDNVLIDGGIAITLFDHSYNGDITYWVNEKECGKFNSTTKVLSDKFEEEIWNKLNPSIFGGNTMDARVMASDIGGGGNDRKYINSKVKNNNINLKTPIKIWATGTQGRGNRYSWFYIEKDDISEYKTLTKAISSRKVMLSGTGHALATNSDNANIINNIPNIIDKDSVAVWCMYVFPEIDDDYHLQLIKSLFMTKTARFLMSITQKDLYVRGFENIPDYTYFIKDLNGNLFTDEFFYKKFNFSKELIDYIESHISAKVEK